MCDTRCICGLMSDKLRILATHQIQFLPSADLVVVVDKGSLIHVGTYDELIEKGENISRFSMSSSSTSDEKKDSGEMGDIVDVLVVGVVMSVEVWKSISWLVNTPLRFCVMLI